MSKNFFKKNLFFGVLILFCGLTFGQDKDKDNLYYLTGKVVSGQGKYPVAMAHVINVKQKWGVVADTLGNFEIWVKRGDTLNISAIGFEYLEYPIYSITVDSSITISLGIRSYEIPEVSISYLGTYKDFEYKVLNLELPEIKINEQFVKLFKHVDVVPYVVPTITSPVSLIFSLFSKEAKAMKKYAELKDREEETDLIREKYNEHIVRNLTGLTGDEVGEFMNYCNFKDTFILAVSDYRLYSEIASKFEEFKKNKINVEKSE